MHNMSTQATNAPTTHTLTKPFLKWAGGKTQIIDAILRKVPSHIQNYHEPFVGGGSVLLAILSREKQKTITISGTVNAYDLNPALIAAYKNVQTNHIELYANIRQLIDEYDALTGTVINRNPQNIEEARTSQESYYYWLRHRYNTLSPDDTKTPLNSALFMVLNKTCFRGLFREGPNGFNVPFGHYKKTPKVIDQEHLIEVHNLIKDVHFECLDFQQSLDLVQENDFVYLDPPYAPECSTSFVGYTKDGFDIEQHKTLFKLTNQLTSKRVKFLMSNSNVPLVEKSFPDDQYTVNKLLCRRSIHSKEPQTRTIEVLISNY